MLGGGPASQYPRSVIEQIRERLPRVGTLVSSRYPQKLRLLACFRREAFASCVRIASHDRTSGRFDAPHRGDSEVNAAPSGSHRGVVNCLQNFTTTPRIWRPTGVFVNTRGRMLFHG